MTTTLEDIYAMTDHQVHEMWVRQRWGSRDTVVCPHCGTIDTHYWRRASKRWKCAACDRTFSVTSGTPFAQHKRTLRQLTALMLSWVNGTVRKDPSAVPTQWHETAAGRFLVSTPEATALELAARQDLAGGPGRVLETLRSLEPSLNYDGFYKAFDVMGDIPSIQRLGAFFNLGEKGSMLAEMIADWLASKPTRAIPLTPGTPVRIPTT